MINSTNADGVFHYTSVPLCKRPEAEVSLGWLPTNSLSEEQPPGAHGGTLCLSLPIVKNKLFYK